MVENNKILTDSFGRRHNYLRISLTDQCNLRCNYCMPLNPVFMPSKNRMSVDEIEWLAKCFVELGINKIRLTGGEPLYRKDFSEILERLSKLNVPLNLTTNGVLLHEHIQSIRNHISSVNISLDTLKESRFAQITHRQAFQQTLSNIDMAINLGLKIKINTVLMRGINDDEIIDFIKLTLKNPIEIRFIEYMPFRGNNWKLEKTVSRKEILNVAENHFTVEYLKHEPNFISDNFRVKDAPGSFGIISTVTQPFCEGCNRIRITADAKLKNCLFGLTEFNLREYMFQPEKFKQAVFEAIQQKHKRYGGLPSMNIKEQTTEIYSLNRSMTAIGG